MSARPHQQTPITIANSFWPLPTVMTAGQPTEAQLRELASAGVTTILDLRPATEERGYDEARMAEAAGLRYRRLPVTAESLDAATFDTVREVLRIRGDSPMLVHCASANRVGAVLLPYLMLDEGMSPDEAIELATRIGLRSPELLAKAQAYINAVPNR